MFTKSKRKHKQYDLLDSTKKYLLSFGDSRFFDYTINKDETRKANSISRHVKEDHTAKNITSAAFMSRWLLWSLPTLEPSIRDVNKTFNINVKLI